MRYGARSMFSMPPATALSMKPSMISCAALAIACAPEPQTRFTVIAGTSTGTPPLIAACRAGFILLPAWDHITHHNRTHVTGWQFRALEHGADDNGAEVGSRCILERAAICADCRAHRRANQDFSMGHCCISSY